MSQTRKEKYWSDDLYNYALKPSPHQWLMYNVDEAVTSQFMVYGSVCGKTLKFNLATISLNCPYLFSHLSLKNFRVIACLR